MLKEAKIFIFKTDILEGYPLLTNGRTNPNHRKDSLLKIVFLFFGKKHFANNERYSLTYQDILNCGYTLKNREMRIYSISLRKRVQTAQLRF